MAEPLTDLDKLLLDRWPDALGLWEAIVELEEKLGERLETIATRLKPWLEPLGYQLLDVDSNRASISVVKKAWLRKRDDAFISIMVGALYPFGCRRVRDEHPFVWLLADGLSEDERSRFQSELSARFANAPEGWINEYCDDEEPLGRFITSHGDRERASLAQSEQELEDFIKRELKPMLDLGGQIDALLLAAKPGLKGLASV